MSIKKLSHIRYIGIGSIYIHQVIPGVVLVDGCSEHGISIWEEMVLEIFTVH
jgi:hypothetical protein